MRIAATLLNIITLLSLFLIIWIDMDPMRTKGAGCMVVVIIFNSLALYFSPGVKYRALRLRRRVLEEKLKIEALENQQGKEATSAGQ